MRSFSPIVCLMSLVTLACVSCGRKDTGVVLIDPDKAVEAVLEDVACDIRIIPLKSDKPIPGISIFFFQDDYFFGISQSEDVNGGPGFKYICVFDYDGNCLGTINRFGRGHDEYLGLKNFIYFKDEHLLTLYDSDYTNPKSYSFRLPGLEYLGSKHSYPMIGFEKSVHMGDGRTLIAPDHGDLEERGIAMAKFLPDTVMPVVDYGQFSENRISPTFYNHQFTSYKNPLIGLFGYNNEIYSIDDNDSLKLEFSFTFADKGLPKQYADDPTHWSPYVFELPQYLEDGSQILYYYPVKNGNLLSFIYSQDQYENIKGFMHFYVTDGSKSVQYSELRIPGLIFELEPYGVNGTSYVFQMTSAPQIDESVPMSGLGQQILDAFKAQNEDNPILLQFRFKDLN